MRSLTDIHGTGLWFMIHAILLILLAGQLLAFLQLLVMKRERGKTGAAALHLLTGSFIYTILMDANQPARYGEYPLCSCSFERWFFTVPWISYAVFEVLSLLILIQHFTAEQRYRQFHLEPDAIYEAVDLLPAGLCVSAGDGTVLLTNLKMNDLCRTLTGGYLFNALTFWEKIKDLGQERGGQYLVSTSSGQVWLFTRNSIEEDGQVYEEMLAADMTAQHRINRELSAMNDQLGRVQIRMKEVSERERSLVRSREIMTARRTVHDQMGNVLLIGKYYLDNPSSIKEEELLHLLKVNSQFLIGEAEEPDDMADPWEEALFMAKRIGVDVKVFGVGP